MIEFFLRLNGQLAHLMTPYINDISLALVATVLVIYGDKLNQVLKRVVSGWAFVARVLAFTLMCTFGYGLLTVWVQPFVQAALLAVTFVYRPLFIVSCFAILGFLAERRRQL
ncbi:DUF3392 family protein [Marinomonas sp. 2405UD68-3]|uniref:DUF3392 family protein n=1 Tax=Marinomonas sp. 2405UD68-3 TaxID=3391835 RepID=UPI0039C9AA0C